MQHLSLAYLLMSTLNVEQIKETSHGLRGYIAETITDPQATHFSEADYQLLKFHGTYQQDDRDQRTARRAAGEDKAWIFMTRVKLPGGTITADRYLALDRLADQVANGTLRITTRQGIQFHGILKVGLRSCIAAIYESGLTTWGACGDVVRNTMASPVPRKDAAHADAQALARAISDTFLARSSAYVDIWINGEKLGKEPEETPEDPIYGRHYLPRKFKIGIAIPPRNDVDIYTQDLGFIAHLDPSGRVEGYTVTVGGGFGMSHGKLDTYPVLAKPLFYVPREHAVAAAIGVVTAQRDHGNRTDRKRARLKYVIETRGVDWFRQEVIARMPAGTPTEPPRPVAFNTVADELGWHEQGDGNYFYGLWVEMGRIKDAESRRTRTALRAIAEQLKKPYIFTPNCNLYITDLAPEEKSTLESILNDHGCINPPSLTPSRGLAHACVALPTCGLALAESERVFPRVMQQIDTIMAELGLARETVLFRMSGCPNGCSRPYNADFAFVGRAPGKYALFIGGSHVGDRLAGLEQKSIEENQIPAVVRQYLAEYAQKRLAGETFTAYWGRTHVNGPAPRPEQFHIPHKETTAPHQVE
jgi:sulfite reductase (ferredoxin)